ncbi:MAG: hypothetical protein HZB16_09975 [Armatimonadetes bacterium]|nr:hypothetical protein [Armatimonadota bacterium]
MPRSVDFSKLPPPEALCFGCGQSVSLSLRARGRGRFRCPHCHNDNRVDHTGLGRPLRRDALAVDHLPEAICPKCGAVNRIPGPLLTGRRYTCFHCRRAVEVPPLMRVIRRSATPWVVALLLVIGVAVARVGRDIYRFVTAVEERISTETVKAMDSAIDVQQIGGVMGPTGAVYDFRGQAVNMLPKPTTLYVNVLLVQGGTEVARQSVALPFVRPGEKRNFQVRVIAPPGTRAEHFVGRLLGVS